MDTKKPVHHSISRCFTQKHFKHLLILSAILSMFWMFFVSWDDKVFDMNIIETASKFIESKDKIYVPPIPDEILDFHRRLNLTNPGYMGKPVKFLTRLPEDIKMQINASYEEFKFNEFVSRLIPLDRELPDYRQGTCKTASYAKNLPKVSVILAFYNEPISMMMRTIYSVLKRSPPELIEEILLVDDCSDKGEF